MGVTKNSQKLTRTRMDLILEHVTARKSVHLAKPRHANTPKTHHYPTLWEPTNCLPRNNRKRCSGTIPPQDVEREGGERTAGVGEGEGKGGERERGKKRRGRMHCMKGGRRGQENSSRLLKNAQALSWLVRIGKNELEACCIEEGLSSI